MIVNCKQRLHCKLSKVKLDDVIKSYNYLAHGIRANGANAGGDRWPLAAHRGRTQKALIFIA